MENYHNLGLPSHLKIHVLKTTFFRQYLFELLQYFLECWSFSVTVDDDVITMVAK